MNFYLIFGLEDYLINSKLNEIIKKLDISNEDIVRLNLDEDSINSLIVEASTVNMFSDKKLIICDNSTFLSGGSFSEEDIKELTKYIENSFKDVYIIFVLREEKLDQRKKITKLLTKEAKVYECNKIDNYNINKYISDYVKDNGYNINNQSIELMISKLGYNLSFIISELDKMFIYKDTDKDITREDIENVVSNNIDNNIFNLSNAIINKDNNKIMKIYKDLILMGEDPIKLLITLSNQFRLILSVKLMRKNGYSENEIISTIKEHPYRIKLAMNSSYSIDDLKKVLLDLSVLDYDIVSGKIDKFFGFEMFLLNI